jgi:hypothetical protein
MLLVYLPGLPANRIMRLTTINGVKTNGKNIIADGTAIPPLESLTGLACATTASAALIKLSAS